MQVHYSTKRKENQMDLKMEYLTFCKAGIEIIFALLDKDNYVTEDTLRTVLAVVDSHKPVPEKEVS